MLRVESVLQTKLKLYDAGSEGRERMWHAAAGHLPGVGNSRAQRRQHNQRNQLRKGILRLGRGL